MTEAPLSSVLHHDGGVRARRGSAAPGVTSWLGLAAAPIFGLMALWTGLSSAPPDMLCMHPASPLTGMTAMYVLMSTFHAGPWLRWLAARS